MTQGTNDPPATQPWERQEGETDRGFAAFSTYLGIGGRRSLSKTAKLLGYRNDRSLAKWSADWGWVARAQAWDEDQARQTQEERAAARRRALDRQAQVAETVIAQSARRLIPPKFHADGKTELTKEERDRWTASNDALRAATTGLKEAATVQRLIYGLPTVITKTQAETEDAIKEALEAQRIVESIVSEYLENDCECDACVRTKAKLQQLHDHQGRARGAILSATD